MKKINFKALLATFGVFIGVTGLMYVCVIYPKISLSTLFVGAAIMTFISFYKIFSEIFKK